MKPEVELAISELVKHGVIHKDEIDSALEKYPESAGIDDRDALGDFLEQIGLITAYQAGELRNQRIADLVMDNYLILDRLGEGGMGTVFRARHKRMRRIVAIKVLNPEIQENADHLQRFQREIETLARLNHQGVIQAYDADFGPSGFFLVLEFVEGSDLDGIVRKHGPLPVGEAIDAMIQSAKALQYVHDQGMVHRDIKPQNLMRNRQGNIKVADLGLVRLNEAESAEDQNKQGLTQQFTIAGTLEFMAPEQAENTSGVDNRADIYSLGCSLYYILAGKNVYTGKSVMDKLMAHMTHPIPSIREIRPDVPEKLDAVFKKMVAKTVDQRYQTMNEVIADLENIKVVEKISNVPPANIVMPAQASKTEKDSSTAFFENPIAKGMPAEFEGTMIFNPGQKTSVQNVLNDSATAFIERPGQLGDAFSQIESTKVLLVEPSKLQGMMIGNQLKSIGITDVKFALSGADALEQLSKGGFKAIVCSQNLPDFSGIELAQKVKAPPSGKDISFILITSNIDTEIESLSATVDFKILRKPFTPEQLQSTLKSNLPTVSITSTTQPSTKTVLLVDDSSFARKRMLGILKTMGFEDVVEAVDGAQGLAMAQSRPFLFVISDFHMPNLDGKGFVEGLSQDAKLKNLPVLLITSEPDSFLLDPIRKLKSCRILSKSTEAAGLKSEISKFIAI
ncbi:MAG: response regulator [Planctomycetes bacterium]|nr:response regulator [Planctomycetota bacterium]